MDGTVRIMIKDGTKKLKIFHNNGSIQNHDNVTIIKKKNIHKYLLCALLCVMEQYEMNLINNSTMHFL